MGGTRRRVTGKARIEAGNAADGAGIDARVLVAGTDTQGRFAVAEVRHRRWVEPPRHLHTREDEADYVLEGLVSFLVDGAGRTCPARTSLLLPRGREHALAVHGGGARLLVLLVPAGLEGCCRELDEAGAPADVERLIAVAARYGVAITGPAPGAPGVARRD